MSTMIKKQQRKREEWSAIILAYQQSNLSKTSFCKAHKLSRSNFYKWEQYFNKAKKEQKPSFTGAFVPVSISDSGAKAVKSQIIGPDERIKSALQLSNNKGLCLLFSNGCSYGELQKVMELLQNAA